MNKKVKTTVLDIALIAMMVALMSVCSWISIPLPGGVSITLQTFAVFVTLGLLGGRRGTFAILIYILMGFIGMPVFAGFSGGIACVLGPTGGYIIGFIFMGIIYWILERFIKNDIILYITSSIIGLIICYAFGTAWFMYVYTQNTGSVSLITTLSWCVFPFILPDLGKIIIGFIIVWRLKKYVPKAVSFKNTNEEI